MRPIRTFTVIPSLPPRLEQLRELAYNMRWSWDYETLELFRRLDLDAWEASGHNPVRMLGLLFSGYSCSRRPMTPGFWLNLRRVAEQFDEYMNAKKTWFRRTVPNVGDLNNRLLLHGVRNLRVPAQLLRWTGCAGGRSSQVRE